MKIMHIAAVLAAFLIIGVIPVSGVGGDRPTLLAQSAHDLMAQASKKINENDYDEAIRLLERANQAAPFDENIKSMLAGAFRSRGWNLYSGENFEDGIIDFKRANAYKPKDHDTYYALGYGSFRLRNYDDALYYLYDAVYMDPDDANGHKIIGYIYYQRGRLAEAIGEWETALRLNREDDELVQLLAKAKKEFTVEGGFDSTETYYFNIKFEGEEKTLLGDLVLEILNRAYRDVGGDLDYFPNEPVTIILYTRQQFTDITDAPSWSNGVFDGNIRVPVGGHVDEDKLTLVLYHEYAHSVVAMMAGRDVPTWLNEGIAQYEERWVREQTVDIRRSAAVPISSLEGPFVGISDPEQARAAYVQSLSVVRYFVQQFGRYNLSRLVRLIGEGNSVPAAVRECTGISYADFERYWLSGLPG